MAFVGLGLGTPAAKDLSHVVNNKLKHMGVDAGLDYSEAIVRQLAQGLDERGLAFALSRGVLRLGSNDPRPIEFAAWLFQAVGIEQSMVILRPEDMFLMHQTPLKSTSRTQPKTTSSTEPTSASSALPKSMSSAQPKPESSALPKSTSSAQPKSESSAQTGENIGVRISTYCSD